MPHRPDLTTSEITQLRQLKLIADNPEITGEWRGPECARLVQLGYAQPVEWSSYIVTITPEGREALETRDAA